MKTLNTALWHEQEMKLWLKFNYHYAQEKKKNPVGSFSSGI